MNQPLLTINGASANGEMPSLKVINPASETVVFEAPSASEHQLDLAVEAARSAFYSWSALPQSERDTYINKIADTIEQMPSS
ncbi:aldehyde dehydrogenase family protein [Vibrio maritimus]|uniref:Aldehyde dehydrogenase family protein n=1 Tax=Vibrio maritimus TaxID=990268 RepID=A0A090SZL7_9VIBR|nr:aldehyde dehydrogenase family protein [Vibrio maritimus]